MRSAGCEVRGAECGVANFTPHPPRPTPNALHPIPYTLHPIPYTLHPTPYTLEALSSLAKGLCLILLIGLLTACGGSQQAVSPPPSISPSLPTLAAAESQGLRSVAPSAIDANWYAYTSADGSYQARFPGKPIEETSALELAAGKTDLILAVYEDKKQGRAYAISSSPISAVQGAPEDIEKRLNDSQKGMANAVEAKVETWQAIVQDGYPGREFTMRKEKTYAAKAKVIYAKGVLYQAVVLVKDENLKSLDIDAFLGSIRLTASQP